MNHAFANEIRRFKLLAPSGAYTLIFIPSTYRMLKRRSAPRNFGFNHPMYPNGDARADIILDLVKA